LLCDSLSWRSLIPSHQRPSLARLFFIRWLGDSVNTMLPAAQVGGEILRIRLAKLWGMSFALSAASVLVDMTMSVLTQIIFALSGTWLLLSYTHRGDLSRTVTFGAVIGLFAVGGFYVVQRIGIFRIGGAIIASVMKSPAWQEMARDGRVVDETIRDIYRRRRSLLACALWIMGTWSTGAVEVWIALHALGVPVSYGKAYVLESASQAIRSALFILPGTLGAQEGGFLAIGALLGISAEMAMALALIRRVREVAFGLPGVIAWQWVEYRRLGKTRLDKLESPPVIETQTQPVSTNIAAVD
jgi:putative membrane protein